MRQQDQGWVSYVGPDAQQMIAVMIAATCSTRAEETAPFRAARRGDIEPQRTQDEPRSPICRFASGLRGEIQPDNVTAFRIVVQHTGQPSWRHRKELKSFVARHGIRKHRVVPVLCRIESFHQVIERRLLPEYDVAVMDFVLKFIARADPQGLARILGKCR